MRGRRRLGAVLLWLLSLGLIACQRDEPLVSSGQPLIVEGRTVLRKGNGAEPQTLDPQRAEDVSSANILRDLYEGLVLMGPGARPIRALRRIGRNHRIISPGPSHCGRRRAGPMAIR